MTIVITKVTRENGGLEAYINKDGKKDVIRFSDDKSNEYIVLKIREQYGYPITDNLVGTVVI